MPRVTFVSDFLWRPSRGFRIRYRAGKTYGITSKCLEEADAAGALAVVKKKPKKTALGIIPDAGE